MSNYHKALKQKEREDEALQTEKWLDENRRAMEADILKKRAKVELFKQQQMEDLIQKQEQKFKNKNNLDDFNRNQSHVLIRNKPKLQVFLKK